MRVCLYIGPDAWATERLQNLLAHNRAALAQAKVLYPESLGKRAHTRAFLSVSDTQDALRCARGYETDAAQRALRTRLTEALAREVADVQPDHVIIAAPHFGTGLTQPEALNRLKSMLAPLSSHIEIIAQIEPAAHMLATHYAQQVLEGRARSLALEQSFLNKPESWWTQACRSAPLANPALGLFPEVQRAPAFIDVKNWLAFWEGGFGAGSMQLKPLDRSAMAGPDARAVLSQIFGVDVDCAPLPRASVPSLPSADWLARARQFNDLLLRRLQQGDLRAPRRLWRQMVRELKVDGQAQSAEGLQAIDAHFRDDLAALQRRFPDLRLPVISETATACKEPEPTRGFRASQYLLANIPRLTRADAPAAPRSASQLPARVRPAHDTLRASPFAPHNRLGKIQEAKPARPYAPIKRPSESGAMPRFVIVGCMKNEAPYILEWVAYHRAIGVDHFLIYTNGCEDGTVALLERLQEMGLVTHRDNSVWRGKSPQQHALNQALKEPVIKRAEWIIHIDIDEFINVRCGNGTLDDLLEQVPDATNIAMTWRLFGHNGITQLSDDLVTAQFDRCAPSYCPKPHTMWGFKTMSRNLGAYQKLSCHRPNKLIEGRAEEIAWVNGSGAPMDAAIKTKGWRNARGSIGYDLVQLNHYALRSAESFLIKRQRGRALHVDRSIGLHYWVRMDWSDAQDVTIQRNLPRLRAERENLLRDARLSDLHEAGLAWHRKKAAELRDIPEFAELYEQAVTLKLSASERAAYAMALDMES